jgi:hypothetical protein
MTEFLAKQYGSAETLTMYYIDIYRFLENPDQIGFYIASLLSEIILNNAKQCNKGKCKGHPNSHCKTYNYRKY